MALALMIFTLEAQLPPIVPIPGIKPGFANIINVLALYILGAKETFLILTLRVTLASVFAGNGAGFVYSISGGILSFVFMLAASKFLDENKLWVVSVLGAIGHNLGQLAAACLITRTWQLAYYLPVLMISAVITGLFTGIAAQAALKKLRKTNILKGC